MEPCIQLLEPRLGLCMCPSLSICVLPSSLHESAEPQRLGYPQGSVPYPVSSQGTKSSSLRLDGSYHLVGKLRFRNVRDLFRVTEPSSGKARAGVLALNFL